MTLPPYTEHHGIRLLALQQGKVGNDPAGRSARIAAAFRTSPERLARMASFPPATFPRPADLESHPQ